MRPFALPLALVLLAVLAGCATTPTETTTTLAENGTLEVRMTGNSSATYFVTARLVANPFENVTVTYANETNRTMPVPTQQGGYTYGPESNVTAIEPHDEVLDGVYFEGSPNFSVTDENVSPTGNLVYTVRKRGEKGEKGEKGENVLAVWGLVRCDGHVSDLSLVANESGLTSVGFACES